MKKIVYILALAVALCACENELANKAIDQETKIDNFIQSKYSDGTVVYNDGVNRIVLEAGDSTAFVAAGDIVEFDYIGYTFESSIKSAFSQGSYTGSLESGKMVEGLVRGMVGMTPGEKSYIIFSCKYGYGSTVAGIGRDQALVFEVILNEINPE